MRKVEIRKQEKVDEEVTPFQLSRALVETENAFRTLENYAKTLQHREEFANLFKKKWQNLSAESAALIT